MEDHDKITLNIPPIPEEKFAIWAIRNNLLEPTCILEEHPICLN
ncbi:MULTISPECIES: hypothetical protein [unclassified Butyricimonas]|nr:MULTISPECIES: hypothetical protein [unclassified Butyricimonas]